VAGLVFVVTCGRLVDGAAVFPGPAALIPVGAAAALILAGNNLAPGARPWLLRYLAARPMVELGALGYALYLWHWPVLIFVLAEYDTVTAGFTGGLAVVPPNPGCTGARTRAARSAARRSAKASTDCVPSPPPTLTPTTLTQLRQDLAVVMSAEAFFTLVDLCELSSADAIASVLSTVRSVTAARLA
jgi:hypothetical protein